MYNVHIYFEKALIVKYFLLRKRKTEGSVENQDSRSGYAAWGIRVDKMRLFVFMHAASKLYALANIERLQIAVALSHFPGRTFGLALRHHHFSFVILRPAYDMYDYELKN